VSPSDNIPVLFAFYSLSNAIPLYITTCTLFARYLQVIRTLFALHSSLHYNPLKRKIGTPKRKSRLFLGHPSTTARVRLFLFIPIYSSIIIFTPLYSYLLLYIPIYSYLLLSTLYSSFTSLNSSFTSLYSYLFLSTLNSYLFHFPLYSCLLLSTPIYITTRWRVSTSSPMSLSKSYTSNAALMTSLPAANCLNRESPATFDSIDSFSNSETRIGKM